MTSTVNASRVRDRAATARRAHSSRPERGRRSGRGAAGPSAATRRAYSRRERRHTGAIAGTGRPSSPRELARRIPFVVLVLVLFAAGMGLTLWLTSSAAARSHRIASAEHTNKVLQDRKQALEKVVQAGNAAPELARKAAALGMVQAQDVARLVVAPDGSVTVHGEPKPAEGPAPDDLARTPQAPQSIPAPASQPAPSGGGQAVLPPADAAAHEDADVLASSAGGPADSAHPGAQPESPAGNGGRTGPRDASAANAPATDAPPIPPADAAPPADAEPPGAARGAVNPADPGDAPAH